MAETLILGGGVAGLAAARAARLNGHKAVVFEARERWGGLLDHFWRDGFRFDRGVHFAFGSAGEYRDLLGQTASIVHHPVPYNYERGRWLKHPVQNNLYPLPAEDKVEAIKSFIERPEQADAPDYRTWLVQQFGTVIAERFPARYTEKYWTVPADKLSTVWIGNRLYRPSLDEVLFGAMTDRTPSTYYLAEMLYPSAGGFRAFIEPLRVGVDLRTGKKAVRVNPVKKYVQLSDGSREHYRYLISSVPLPELAAMLEGAPAAIKETAQTLWASSIALVSLGFSSPQAGEHLWFYIYDRDIRPARVHAPYRKAADNVPSGCSSLQFETYYSRYAPLTCCGDELVEQVIAAVEKMGLASRSDLVVTDYRTLPYANVVFDRGMTDRRDFVLRYIRQCEIIPVGRFGKWDYLWAGQSFNSGRQAFDLSGTL